MRPQLRREAAVINSLLRLNRDTEKTAICHRKSPQSTVLWSSTYISNTTSLRGEGETELETMQTKVIKSIQHLLYKYDLSKQRFCSLETAQQRCHRGNKVMNGSGWRKTNSSLILPMQEQIKQSSEKAGSKQSKGRGSSHQTLLSCEMPCHRMLWTLAIYWETRQFQGMR